MFEEINGCLKKGVRKNEGCLFFFFTRACNGMGMVQLELGVQGTVPMSTKAKSPNSRYVDDSPTTSIGLPNGVLLKRKWVFERFKRCYKRGVRGSEGCLF